MRLMIKRGGSPGSNGSRCNLCTRKPPEASKKKSWWILAEYRAGLPRNNNDNNDNNDNNNDYNN